MIGGGGEAFVGWVAEALLASALLIAVVLLIRVPVRRLFGAPVAYALWALPLLRLVLPPMPAAWRESVAAPVASLAAPITDVGQQVTILIVPAADGAVASVFPIGITLAMLWGAGAAAFLAWHVAGYRRFRRRVLTGAQPIERVGGVTVVASAAAAGPLAFGVVRRFVAFPRDFAGRYDADERALALAHELGHHLRGDLIANWAALGMLALHWFNPLAWIAFRAFRADQELANDARVLAGRSAAERHAYACAIVKSAHGGAIAAACHLHNVQHLKGRLRMLAAHRNSPSRLAAGVVAVAGVTIAGLGVTASGTQAAERVREQVEAATGVALPRPVAADATADRPVATPEAPATPAPATRRTHRVVIVENGKRTVYEGAAADAYVAAHPLPVPPAPPAPATPVAPGAVPAPPVPPAPPPPGDATAGRHVRVIVRDPTGAGYAASSAIDVPEVREGRCAAGADQPMVERSMENGRRRIVICTDRIERAASRAGEAAAAAEKSRRYAMAGSLRGMRAARSAITGNPNLSETQRAQALAGLDSAIARMERDGEDE